MSSDHAVTHTHSHTHRLLDLNAPRYHAWVTHEHEHDHSSLRQSFATEGDPPHRMHFHVPKNDPRNARK